MKNISILGCTGSIGTQTLDVVRKNRDEYNVVGVTANTSSSHMIEIIEEFSPSYVAMMDEVSSKILDDYCKRNNKKIKVLNGIQGLSEIASLDEIDTVVTSVVGMIGLKPTIAAIEKGKNIALANKETLVAAGHIVMKMAKEKGVNILPVDSEHSAIFQSLQGNSYEEVNKILLTASGGPFRGMTREELSLKRAEDAIKHPKWNMGKKISVDSSTLMNKGLEVIEAHWLFDVGYEDIQVVVHPQSIIHSMVEYVDGSIIAQLSSTDMRLPIQYALNYPNRRSAVIEKLDLFKLSKLEFFRPEIDTFRCLKLAYETGKVGGNATAILNSSNEVAVELFLENKIGYLNIEAIIEDCLNKFEYMSNPCVDEIVQLHGDIERYVKRRYI